MMTGRRFMRRFSTPNVGNSYPKHIISDGLLFTELPEDVIVLVLSYLDSRSLCRLCQVCKLLQKICEQACVWKKWTKRLTICSNGCDLSNKKSDVNNIFNNLSLKDQCRIGFNWANGSTEIRTVMRYHVRQLPCLSRDDQYIWISSRSSICCFRQQPNSTLREIRRRRLQGVHHEDVSKFKARDDLVVSGGSDGSISCWNGITGNRLFHRPASYGHRDDVSCIDIRKNIIISGSRDKAIKVWSINRADNDNLVHTIGASDRMWSVAISNDLSCFAGGTGGHNPTPPLRLWDIDTGQLQQILSSEESRNGAGVLDLHFENPQNLWSCGYDACTRLWDTRTGTCVINWEDPYDTTIYCLEPCGPYGIVCGTSMYGVVRLWDKRYTKSVQMFYTMDKSGSSTPVYSILANPRHLYVALDKCIRLVNFDVFGSHAKNNNIAF